MEQSLETDFKREIDALTTLRDELKVKAHLAKADLKAELDRLENKWSEVQVELSRAKNHAKDNIASLNQGTKKLLDDLKQGYESVKSRLS